MKYMVDIVNKNKLYQVYQSKVTLYTLGISLKLVYKVVYIHGCGMKIL